MCEGKFLVKTNVSDNNVIRTVTVENFRFGVRVVKKREGSWTCQDLNVTESGPGSGSGCGHTSYHSLRKKNSSDGILKKRNEPIISGASSTNNGNGNNNTKSVIRVDTQQKDAESQQPNDDNRQISLCNIRVNKNRPSSPVSTPAPVLQEERPSSKLYVALSAASSSSQLRTSSFPTTHHQGTEDSVGERLGRALPHKPPTTSSSSTSSSSAKELLLLLSSPTSKSASSSKISILENNNYYHHQPENRRDILVHTRKTFETESETETTSADAHNAVGVGRVVDGEQPVTVNNDLGSFHEILIPNHSVSFGPGSARTYTTIASTNTRSNNHSSILYKHLSNSSESLSLKDKSKSKYYKCLNNNYSSTSTFRSRQPYCTTKANKHQKQNIPHPPGRKPRGEPSQINFNNNNKNNNNSCPTQYQISTAEFAVNDTNSDTLLKNPYLTKILGTSPLLKLQLLNLLVVPLEDQRTKFPDLIPRQNISRLKMLFDEDGNERVGVAGGTETDREQKRSRDKDLDEEQLDIKKRVKMEPEDEDNLVIDENMGYGEELSENENSEDLGNNINNNDGGARMDVLEDSVGQQNSVKTSNSCVPSGNRSSSDLSFTSLTRNKKLNSSCNSNSIKFAKNGHDTSVSRVPKLSSSQTVSSKFINNNSDECNNLGENAESNSSCGADSKIHQLEREIAALTSLLKTKEKEWNSILRLKKLKEMNMEFLRRQKDVDELFDSETIQQHEEYLKTLTERINLENEKIGSDETQVCLSKEKTEKEIKIAEKKNKKSRVHVNGGKVDQSKEAKQNDAGHMDNIKASLALQQLCERNRTTLVQANSPVQLSSGSPKIQNKVIGEGRQGTIVEVKSIIADYRSKNPDETTGQTSEARRRVQEKGSSSNQSGGSSIISQNRNVSFKDVLVNLAKLSQNEKSSGPVTITSTDNITVTPRTASKTNSSMLQANSYGTSRGQLGTTLAKLLSSNSSSSNIPVGIVHPDGGSSASSIKIDAVNHAGDSNLSLANLLASAKCRDDEIKTEEDDLVPICQGCNANRAQFVCAGCGNQWYCCRECQIQAWEDHSEVCSG